jgi:hypothetical protein
MEPIKTRWKLLLVTLAVTVAWSVIGPASLILAIGLLSAFGSVFAWVQYAIEASPERSVRR